MHIAILDDYHHGLQASPDWNTLQGHAQVTSITFFPDPTWSLEQKLAAVQNAEIVVALRERTPFPRTVLQQLPRLRLIVQTGNHAYHIDREAANDLHIAISLFPSTSGGSNGAAELTIGLMLAVTRHISAYDALVHAGGWEMPYGTVLQGKTLGILGLGHVGGQVARIAHAMGMTILAWSPHLTPTQAQDCHAQSVSLDTLLRSADVVSCHLALTPQSRGLLGPAQLSLLRPTAIVINTARGPIIDEAALVAALSQGRLAGAGLDVFDQEPLPIDHPLRQLSNVVLTPHAGWPTDYGYQAFAQAVVTMIQDFLDGHNQYVVNPEAITPSV